ncbi:MAG TPA: hypothetical protein VD931_04725, partial [Baekduia sp.]|nr:hypothetical protein [Baekduia sp.]
MGLLDDAIREHLELKRRRGADAEEVSRQEAEALGPARRSDLGPAMAPPPAEERAAAPVSEQPVPEPALEEPAAAYADDGFEDEFDEEPLPPPARAPEPPPAVEAPPLAPPAA